MKLARAGQWIQKLTFGSCRAPLRMMASLAQPALACNTWIQNPARRTSGSQKTLVLCVQQWRHWARPLPVMRIGVAAWIVGNPASNPKLENESCSLQLNVVCSRTCQQEVQHALRPLHGILSFLPNLAEKTLRDLSQQD